MDNTEILSKKLVPFGDIVDTAEAIEGKRIDKVVKDVAKNFGMDTSGNLYYYEPVRKGPDVMQTRPASSWALRQLGTKLGIPSTYLEKCISSGIPALAAENVNTWFKVLREQKKASNFLVREYDGTIDGILSDRYTSFDSPKILDVVSSVVNVDDYDVRGSYISDERMHIRMIGRERLNVYGEDLFPGLFIDSSDVGRTSLNVRFGIWKQVCTNGLCIRKVGGTMYYQRHVGVDPIEVEVELINSMKKIPDIQRNAEEIIRVAAADKLDLRSEKSLEEIIHSIRRYSLMTEDEAKKVIEIAKTKYSETKWGIVNAMTELAQEYTLDDRIKIENAAGILIAA